MKGLQCPHAKLMVTGGHSSPLACILLKALALAFPDKAFPRDDIHVFHSGEYVWNPFGILRYAYGLSHSSDLLIPAAKYVSPYSLFRNAAVARISPEKNTIIASHNMKSYSYEYLINAIPAEESFFDIEGCIVALDNNKAPVHSFSSVKHLDKLSEHCSYLLNRDTNSIKKKFRKLCEEGGDIHFYNANTGSDSCNIALSEAAIFLKNAIARRRGKDFANKCRIKLCLSDAKVHSNNEIDLNMKQILWNHEIDTAYHSTMKAVNSAEYYWIEEGKKAKYSFDMLILTGRLTQSNRVAGIEAYPNVLSVNNCNLRYLLFKEEVLKVIEKVSDTFKLKIENYDKIGKALNSLNYLDCSLQQAYKVNGMQEKPSFKQWITYKYAQKILL